MDDAAASRETSFFVDQESTVLDAHVSYIEKATGRFRCGDSFFLCLSVGL